LTATINAADSSTPPAKEAKLTQSNEGLEKELRALKDVTANWLAAVQLQRKRAGLRW
jgi:DNA-binding HxlR family transcriptional regulator